MIFRGLITAALVALVFGLVRPGHTSMPLAGILVNESPSQGNPITGKTFHIASYTLQAVAPFSVKARVLFTEQYRWFNGADLSPIDLTLGWGRMSDSAVLDKLTMWHGHRNYGWYVSNLNDLPIPRSEITESSANMHLIPAMARVKRALLSFSPHDVVSLKGYLVDASKPDGWEWKTSRTRSDSGDGACELFWVEEATPE